MLKLISDVLLKNRSITIVYPLFEESKMFNKSIFLFLILLLVQSCNRNNPVGNQGYYSEEEIEIINSIEELIVDNYIDSINFNDTIELDSTLEYGEVKFEIDISNGRLNVIIHGLGKISSANLNDLRDYQIAMINAVTLKFIRIDDPEEDTLDFAFPIVDGKCETKVVKIPKNYNYQVLVSFWEIKQWPWDILDFKVYARVFSALDTINLTSKAKDTLDLVFVGSKEIKFFFEFRNMAIGSWTEDSVYSIRNYDSGLSTPTLCKNGSLFGCFTLADRRDSASIWAVIQDDTGEVFISFLPDIPSLVHNNGIVVVNPDSVFLGKNYINHREIPLDNLPQHPF